MLTFLKLSLGLLDSADESTTTLAHATYRYGRDFENGITFSDSGMALGWSVVDSHNGLPTLLHKNGWVSGFNTWVMIVPSEGIGVFSMSNRPFLEMQGPLENIVRMVLATRE